MNGRLFAIILLGLAAGGCATTAPEADEPVPPEAATPAPAPVAQTASAEPSPVMVPNDTASWLELQRAGTHEGMPNPVSGDVAARVYQRHLNSFETPIPAHFETGGSSWN